MGSPLLHAEMSWSLVRSIERWHDEYDQGHSPSVESVKVARPRLPIIQMPGHTPGTPGRPGSVYEMSMMPPCMQNLFQPCTLPLAK